MIRSAKAHGKVFAVYDMSSSSVAGAHVLATTTEGKPKTVFLASSRVNAPLQEDMDMQRFVEETIKHLGQVVANIRKADVHHPSYIQVTLASPWYTSQTRTILYKKDVPFVCTQKLIDTIIADEIDHILSKEEGSFGVFGTESVIVEKQLSAIILNGYHTTNPFGKKATTLELSLTITIAPKAILDRFTDVLRRVYGTTHIGFTTSPFTTFVVMRDLNPATEDCVVIDVGEEVTDVAFIKHGIVLYQHSFPVGTYGLYRALAGQSSNTARESMTLLESYRLGKLSPRAAQGIETSITAFATHWQSWFHQILDTGEYGFCIPEHCIVTTDPRFELLFAQTLGKDMFVQQCCSTGAVRVLVTNEELFRSQVSTLDQTPLDIPLATAALFVERLV
ncbi:MAG: hypothetical protein KBB91_00205 [Candidatus Pacebacteria bacterium]|jgi:hypothetical protein|nr:hypothetical protein [Candidatus Paceibacterota bacterium]MBP9700815.1 hypothetical protein [Candidatus Paceibacterota bacterium]